MRTLHFLLALAACTLAGGCVESEFDLARSSPLPAGLRDDAEACRAAETASKIELWLYTYNPPRLKFKHDRDVFLTREADPIPFNDSTRSYFFLTFHGVESGVRHVAFPNVVTIIDDPTDARDAIAGR